MAFSPDLNDSDVVSPERDDSRPRAAMPSPRPRRALPIVLAALVGLLAGWLVIGWWLWPIEWTSSSPWQLRPDYQKTYLTLVAHEYARTSNLAYVEDLLAGWDRADLAQLLAAAQREASDPETREHVAALADMLRLPSADTSLSAALLSQEGFVVGVVGAAAPLLAALALVAATLARRRDGVAGETASIGATEQGLEELLADVAVDDQSAVAEQSPDTQETEQRAPSAQAEEEKKTEEAPPDQAGEEEAEEADGGLGDLASLFEIEDTTLAGLEAFCKDMLEVNVQELSTTAREVLGDLQLINRSRPEPALELSHEGS